MFRHLVQTVGYESMLDRVNSAVISIHIPARKVRETLVFIVDLFDWHMSGFNSLLMFLMLYVDLTEVCNGDVRRAS